MTSIARPFPAWRMLTGILLIAATLRVSFTGAAPVLDIIRSAFHLSAAWTGLLTTLPLLAFAVISPLAAGLARRFSPERCLYGALVIICLGIGLRSAGYVMPLFLGTLLIGAGIALGNVLLPGLIKRDFPGDIPRLTGAYSLTMGIAAGLGSVLVVPIEQAGAGWQGALLSLAVVPLCALFFWAPMATNKATASFTGAQTLREKKLWHSPLAWFITFFLGINSLIYYVVIGWLPIILTDAGYTDARAGSLHGIMQLACAVPGIFIGSIISRMQDQRIMAILVSAMCAIGLAGLWLIPGGAPLWSVLFGFGSGATMILGLSFIGLKTGSAHQAAALSGMAQSIGYLLAALGPTLAGKCHDITNSWHGPLAACTLLAIIMAVCGAMAGRSQNIC